ncbi:MAG TPA: hypothetical protein VFQ39_19445 [Longimicrobium sp.]|nr:hypothetical protein [Longimicrobium sp.]
MRLVIQRSPDPVPYRGAYFRIAPEGGNPSRASVVLAPPGDRGDDANALAHLLALAVVLGDAPAGGAPISQHWLEEDGKIEGKLGSPLSPRHTERARTLAARIAGEWDRFLAAAFARLRGEARGDAHFRFPDGGWSAEQPSVLVTAWPPLEGETLPTLE